LGGATNDFAMQIIQRGKESNRTAAVVIVGLGADMPFAQRQDPLAPPQSLDLAFLITTDTRQRPMTSQSFASKSGSAESLKTSVRYGLISLSLQTRRTVALETANSLEYSTPPEQLAPSPIGAPKPNSTRTCSPGRASSARALSVQSEATLASGEYASQKRRSDFLSGSELALCGSNHSS
jgi:hypothetical protein